jgi:hypothetical protein
MDGIQIYTTEETTTSTGNTNESMSVSDYKPPGPTPPGILAGEIIIFLVSFGGLFINLLVFYILAIRISVFKIDSVLSGLTTIFDIIASFTMMIRLLFKWVLLSMGKVQSFENLCNPTGILFFASTITAFDIVSVLGLIRCLAIVFSIKMGYMFWTFIIVVLLTFNWTGASALEWNLPEISWNDFCRKNDSDFDTVYMFGEVESIKAIVMLIILVVSYSLIFRFYRKFYENIKKSSSADQHLINEISTQKKNTSFKLLLLILSYVIIYIPKVTIFILYNLIHADPNYNFEMVSAVLYSMSTIVNASVLLFIQDETKQEIQYIWTLVVHRGKSILK